MHQLEYFDGAIAALDEASALLHRVDTLYGLNEEQERIMVAIQYEYTKLCEEANRLEERLSYD